MLANEMNSKPIPLTSAFHYEGWTIKYALLTSSTSPSTTNAATTTSSNPQLQTLIFIHGTPWSSAVFAPLATSLLSTHPSLQILLYDLPGYGASQQYDPPDTTSTTRGFAGNTSISSQASAFTALLSHLSLTNLKPAVIAHDIAGSIALRSHLLHSKLDYSRLMLLDTNVVLPWGDGFYKLVRSQPEVFTQLPGHVHEAVVRSVVRSASTNMQDGEVSGGGEQNWEDVLTDPWIGSEQSQSSFVRQVAQANDEDVAEMYRGELYGNVRCPVRVLWGEKDSWIPREKMEELCGLLGERLEKEMVVVEGAGHLVMLDRGNVVEREVREWLGLIS